MCLKGDYIMNKEEAFKIGLPKWCQMVVNGDKITQEQSEEIIRRTDSSIVGMYFRGNNDSFNKEAEKILDIPKYEKFKDNNGNTNWNAYYSAKDEWLTKFGVIKELGYLTNNWLSCCWVGGVHGWCSPTGEIAFQNNIGKWASVEEVYNEWCVIAKEFPFLNLTCTLMDGEEDYCTNSLVTIKVSNGEVDFCDTIPYEKLEFNGVKFNLSGCENYYPLTKIQEWADKYLK